ncbi:hypothetical protein [Archangium sp.]|uniref:hypothetical protein n=1 Tax=Archangium sp. TaxID=1872627 RepID=UPI00286B5340|nr:hypothetical protein [Archangium sp.]
MMEGRFTLRGSAAVEAQLAGMVMQASAIIGARVRPEELRALALIGGYGRGEGGVERRAGGERPHNNLDFLLVLNGTIRPGLKQLLDEALEPLREQYAVGLDLGIVTARALRRAPCLVMWYDMRYGHKTALGDTTFLPSLTHFSREAIVPGDVRDLLVNRGTLLVINEALLEQGGGDEERRCALIRHAAKAIIGYGDTLLFFRGRYHWSYVEKRRRVAELRDVPAGFRQLYEEASAFRFEPDYDSLAGRDLPSWLEEVRGQLSDVHLACEAIRMDTPGLQWSDYFQRVLRHTLVEGGARVWMRKVRNAVRFRPFSPPGLGWRERLGLQLGGGRGLLAAVFPYIAYGVGGEQGLELTRHALGARGNASELRRAYLRAWGEVSDANFALMARRCGLDLEARGR